MGRVWNGVITFGLVNIPISLINGMNPKENVHFNFLRKSDHSRIQNKRVAEADQSEVSKDEIVKGYEYEKDKYVEVSEEDFQRAAIESTHTLEILNFVPMDELSPIYFSKPYFVQPQKSGEKGLSLLTRTLSDKNAAGISKIVLQGYREHLVALIPGKEGLVAEILHYPEELRPADAVKIPEVKVSDRELDMAKKLVESMMSGWNPEEYKDAYENALKQMIEDKVGGKEHPKATRKPPQSTKVVNMVDILKQSIERAAKRPHSTSRISRTTSSRSTSTHKVPAA